MKKIIQRFHKDVKGAVVVFVTLLLIPALLISGTGVDLARIYTAKSIMHDANQLASNSALASYDALLHDLYGLYGIMSEDEELAGLINQYIEAAIFPEDAETGLGTFQLMYGSNLTESGMTVQEGRNLANPEVLRRQIEEYAKFRAPAIIITEILDRLEAFKKAQKDAEAIEEKMEIDDKIEEIDELYRRIYNCIQEINKTDTVEAQIAPVINEYYRKIKLEAKSALDTRSEWTLDKEDYESAIKAGNHERADELEDNMNRLKTKYEGHLANIRVLIKGGVFKSGWQYVDGSTSPWMNKEDEQGLTEYLKQQREKFDKIIDNTTNNLAGQKQAKKKADSIEELVLLCEEADSKKVELQNKVNSLEGKLNSGECSEDLKKGMNEPSVPVKNADGSESKKSIMEVYRSLIKYDLTKMGNAVKSNDVPQIRKIIEQLDPDIVDGDTYLPGVYYGDKSQIEKHFRIFKLHQLEEDFKSDTINLNHEYINYISGDDDEDELDAITSFEPDKFVLSSDPFYDFQDNKFDSTGNAEFYRELERLYNGESQGKKKSDNLKSGINNLLKRFKTMYDGLFTYEPEGAYEYTPGTDESAGATETSFGDSAGKDDIKNGLNDTLLSKLGNAFGEAGNKILLLTYDSEMFSCYATGKSEEGEEKTMTGIPLGIDVNYYYQSEMEYLFHGNEKNAVENLKAVAGMILLVRFVFNYIASFRISSVNHIVQTIEEGLAFLGPVAVAVGELARLTIAFGESAMDVGRLKEGCRVTLIKDDSSWKLGVSLEEVFDVAAGTVKTLSDADIRSYQENRDDDDKGVLLVYKDYMRLFLLLRDGDVLASRTAWLIGMNMTNKKESIGAKGDHKAREDAMASATKYDMSKAITDFSMTTTIDLRMLFLSMPFAQRGVNGVVPPGTLRLSVTDYRGY